MATTPMELADQVPVVALDRVPSDIDAAADQLRGQLDSWGFMAINVPGASRLSNQLMNEFLVACNSSKPSLLTYSHDRVPQVSISGNHGYFPFYSEVPRLAAGVADPKEYMHISGWMLEDNPPGSAEVFKVFPQLGSAAREAFLMCFELVTSFARVIGGTLPAGAPPLKLSQQSSILRVIHYRNTDARQVLAHEHSGIQMLGIQLPPSDQGLQYVLNDGSWVEPVLAGTDVVLCNIGRMLTFASNNRLRPSTHRVHQDHPVAEYERLSAVLFVYPDHADRQWQVSEAGVKWHEATWGDFVRNRFQAISRDSLESP